MHKGMFAEEELRYLRSLDAVERAEPLRITCSKEFKREFMRRCHGGERPRAIFGPAGLEAGPLGCRRIGRACAHRRGAETKGAPCLADGKNPARGGMRARERRRASEGCAAIRASRDRKVAGMEGRPAKRRRQARTREEEPIASQAAEIAALKAQAKALKALGALARRARRAPQAAGKPERPEATFRLGADDPASSASAACEVPGVSRRGHCGWMAAAPGRAAREKADLEAKEQVEAAYGCRGFGKGSRQVVDCLRRKQGVVMSRRKVQRIARKYDLAPRRKKKNPCHPIGADGLPKVAANVVNRQFRRGQPLKVISTDMTYLPGRDGFSYLSGVIDCETDIVLAHVTSNSMEEQLVLDTYDQLKEIELPDGIWACSGQGVHYTARAYRDKLEELGISQSMSRKACCWDNAPIESFWGRMKEQIGDTSQMSHEEIVALVDDYIDYYNNERGQARLDWLTPHGIRCQARRLRVVRNQGSTSEQAIQRDPTCGP